MKIKWGKKRSNELTGKSYNEMTYEERRMLLIGAHENSKKAKEEYKPTPVCHKGNVEAFKDPSSGLVLYGGGSYKGCLFEDDMLALDLANNYPPIIRFEGVEMKSVSREINSKVIQIEWPDRDVPDVSKKVWELLVKELREQYNAGKIPGKILVCCVGGHGRTGTALSILAGLMGRCKTDPVKFIRDSYCKNAVESDCQLDYVERITGIKVNEIIHKVATVVVAGKPWEDESYSESYDWRKYTKAPLV